MTYLFPYFYPDRGSPETAHGEKKTRPTRRGAPGSEKQPELSEPKPPKKKPPKIPDSRFFLNLPRLPFSSRQDSILRKELRARGINYERRCPKLKQRRRDCSESRRGFFFLLEKHKPCFVENCQTFCFNTSGKWEGKYEIFPHSSLMIFHKKTSKNIIYRFFFFYLSVSWNLPIPVKVSSVGR